MATKNVVVREALTLFSTTTSLLMDLDRLEETISIHSDKTLADLLTTCQSKTAKILGEGLTILQQHLPQSMLDEITDLQQQVTDFENQLTNFASIQATEMQLLAVEGDLGKIAEFMSGFNVRREDLVNIIYDTRKAITRAKMFNLMAANDHVANALAPLRSKNNADNDHSPFEFGCEYDVVAFGKSGTLELLAHNSWSFLGDDNTYASSEEHPDYVMDSPTAVKRALRILSGDYEHKNDGWLVMQGDLSSANATRVNAGGTGGGFIFRKRTND